MDNPSAAPHPRTRRRGRIAAALAAFATMLLAASAGVLYDGRQARTLVPGTVIGGMDVGGLALDEATGRIRAARELPLRSPLRVTADGLDEVTSAWDVGLRIDAASAALSALRDAREGSIARRFWRRLRGAGPRIGLPPTLDRDRLDAFVAAVAARVAVVASDATVDVVDGWVHVRPSREGRELDLAGATDAIAGAARAGATTTTVPVRAIAPAIPTSAYAQILLVRAGENRLYLYENGGMTRSYAVATGAPEHPTPAGRFRIVNMRRNPTWVNPGSDWARSMPGYIPPGPDNPLGSRAMDLDADGIRIHGTPDAASIGFSVSHGCIRMHMRDAEDLFGRVAVGATVVIEQVAPPRARPRGASGEPAATG